MKEKNVQISTTIPISVYERIQKINAPYNHLIQRGLLVVEGEPQQLGRIKELEEQNERQILAMDRYKALLFETQHKLEVLEGKQELIAQLSKDIEDIKLAINNQKA